MKFSFKTKVIVPATKKPVEVVTLFEFDTDLIEGETDSGEDAQYEEVSDVEEDFTLSGDGELMVERVESYLPHDSKNQMGYRATLERRKNNKEKINKKRK